MGSRLVGIWGFLKEFMPHKVIISVTIVMSADADVPHDPIEAVNFLRERKQKTQAQLMIALDRKKNL